MPNICAACKRESDYLYATAGSFDRFGGFVVRCLECVSQRRCTPLDESGRFSGNQDIETLVKEAVQLRAVARRAVVQSVGKT